MWITPKTGAPEKGTPIDGKGCHVHFDEKKSRNNKISIRGPLTPGVWKLIEKRFPNCFPDTTDIQSGRQSCFQALLTEFPDPRGQGTSEDVYQP